ncbi:MAG: hypothetical protein ACE148_01175 [Vicinamibacterales bacterium]
MLRRALPGHIVTLVAYIVVTILFTWPLALRLGSHLPGPVGGDTGVYVWNLWVFQDEALAGHFPLYTDRIFSLDEAANLARHNYTLALDIVALPFVRTLGVVPAFNLILLALFVLNAWGMFALARRLRIPPVAAWLSGLLFAFCPSLVARSTAHISLVAAAPLPLFVLCLLNATEGNCSRRWWIAAGATLAWATWCDPYYGIYCVLLAAWHSGSLLFEISFGRRDPGRLRPLAWLLEGLLVAMLALITIICASGGLTLRVAGLSIGLRTLYTPVLLACVAATARLLLVFGPRIAVAPIGTWIGALRAAPYGMLTAVVLLAPTLYALLASPSITEGIAPETFWRSSTPGLDLLSILGPNPNVAWLEGWRAWLSTLEGGFAENVGSVTFSMLIVVALAVVKAGFRPSRYWACLALVAGGIALGPFVHVGGINTHIPTPWTFLRFAPLVGAARAPARFSVLVMLAGAVLFGLATKALMARYDRRHDVVVICISGLLILELYPAPRPLYSAEIPIIYGRIAADERDIRVLELPCGIRDGLSSYGNFSASTQYFQTYHEKRLIGGYKSRVTERRIRAIARRPVLAALVRLSEGKSLPDAEVDRLSELGPRFVKSARIGYVVIDHSRASQELVDFAVRVLALQKIGEAGSRELFRPMP